jgi:transcriptional regulator with XRE-family HTH domain
MHLGQDKPFDLVALVRLECAAFAAKIRMVRAVLGWSQSELASRIGLTQRAVHKLEQGQTEPRRTTVRAIEEVWREAQIEFEDTADGGFRIRVSPSHFDPEAGASQRRTRRSVISRS